MWLPTCAFHSQHTRSSCQAPSLVILTPSASPSPNNTRYHHHQQQQHSAIPAMSSRGKALARSNKSPKTSCIFSDPIHYLIEKYRNCREARRARRHAKQKPPSPMHSQPTSMNEKQSRDLGNKDGGRSTSDSFQDVTTPELEEQRDEAGALTLPALQRSRVLAPAESPAHENAPIVPEDERHLELRRMLKESLAKENLPGKKKKAKWQSTRLAGPRCDAANRTILGRMKRSLGKVQV